MGEKTNTQNIPPLKAAYISAVTSTSCTISGAPSTIDVLRSSPALGPYRLVPLHLASPFHGPHLPLLSTTTRDLFLSVPRKGSGASQLPVRVPLLSASTGRPLEGATFRDLVPGIVDDVFRNRIHEPLLIQACGQRLSSSSDQQQGASLVSIVAPGLQRRFEAGLAALNAPLLLKEAASSTDPSGQSETDVAIVGMSGRFPGAASLDDFWTVLEAGVDLCREIPADRFDVQTHHDHTGKTSNTTLSPYGCFLDQPGLFDARLFNMSPREAASTDPGQRLLLMATYEALEMAGYTSSVPSSSASHDTKVGTFFGQTIDDWREYNAAENVDMYYVTGGIRAFSAGRVNYHFKWDGPSYSVDSACSSSLLAIQLAYNSLRAGECNMAVAGGSNILTGCNMYAGLSRGSFLSTTGPCKTFDSSADGYCRGEGVGVVVLKRLADAVANRDPILAVIKSAATNHSAQAVSITHPHVETQERLFRDVLGQAGVVDPAEVDYVECHGTGTQAGDGAESHSVVNVFCKTPRQQPLMIGSIKPNIGHGEAAAGVCSLIKTILMLQHDRILPHVGVKGELNPKLPPFRDQYEIATSSAFPRPPGKTRKLMINNFSAAGGNTSIFLADKPCIADEPPSALDPRDVHVVTISAKSSVSLRGNLERLQQYLAKQSSSSPLADIAYTSTARRLHHPLREAYAVTSVSELSAALAKACAGWDGKQTAAAAAPAAPSVAFVFPGQGQGVMGVARELHETSPSFRRILGELDALCTAQGLPSIVETLSEKQRAADGLSTVESQLGLALLEVALARLWKSWGVEPSLVVGHSLGEYAALYVAGVLSAADLIFLVGKRASLMQERCTRGTHKMVSLRMSAEDVRRALPKENSSSLEITCVNGPQSTVVAGCAGDIETFVAQQQALGVSAVVLDVPYSFHSAQMDPILETYEREASRVQFAAPQIAVASSLLGSVVEQQGVFDASYLSRHARQPVLFSQAVHAAHSEAKTDHGTMWLEMGPGMVSTSLVKQSLRSSVSTTTLPTLDAKKGAWQSISATLATLYARGVNVNWTEFHRDYKQARSVVSLPHYAFDVKNYWLDYTSRNDLAAPAKHTVPEPKYVFQSPCWQQIADESFGPSEALVKFTSDLHQPELAAMVHGHAVGGISLCPSSVYGSIAFSCASYIFKRRDASLETTEDVPPMALSDMEIFSPCVVTRDSGQRHLLQVTATQASSDGPVELVFSSASSHDEDDSVDEAGRYREHARCTVHLTSKAEAFSDATKNLYLIQDRVEMLRRREREGDVDKLRKKMVYKLFRAVVDYEARYHTLDDVLLSADRPEACAKLSFDTPAEPENFVHNPFWIDSLAQLGGFSLNVNPPSGEDDVYISHGWQSMRILRRLSAREQYMSYVCMQPSETEVGLYSGDMYVYNEQGTVVAMVAGLKFKQMKRTLLYHLLGHALPSTPSSSLSSSVSSSVSSSPSRPTSSRRSSMPLPKPHSNNRPIEHRRRISVDTESLSRASRASRHSSPARRARSRSNFPAAVQRLRASTSVCSTSRFSDADSAIDVGGSLSPSGSATTDLYDQLLSIIAREVGVDRGEILPWTKFSDIGMDSLLTITVLATFREEGGLSLPSSFFNDHPTPKDMEAGLPCSTNGPSKYPSIDELEYLDEEPEDLQQVYESKPILIQGTPTPNGQAFFLLPDGSGSALSYVNLPALTSPAASSLPVYALNSPYLSNPEIFLQESQSSCFEQFAGDLVRTIRSLQPHGPYLIAGWSMGGIFAFEAARQLLAAGEAVELLGFIDSPCPGTLPPLPAPTLSVLDKAGLLCGMDGRGVSHTTKQHFLASVRALGGYNPQPLPTGKLGKVVAIWAKDSLLVDVTDEKKRQALLTNEEIAGEARDWLLGKRKSFGAAGWDRLVGKEVSATSIAGNHFSIMSPPLVSGLLSLLVGCIDVLLT